MHPCFHYSTAEFRKQVNGHINLRLQRKTDNYVYKLNREKPFLANHNKGHN